MARLFIVFNHTLTKAQEQEAMRDLGVEEIVEPPGTLGGVWAQIPAETDTIKDLLTPLVAWLEKESVPGDFVLAQGDFGATYLLVDRAFELGLQPIYSTTRREAIEKTLTNGEIETSHLFQHVRFRYYGR